MDVGMDRRATEMDDLKARAVHDPQGIAYGRFADQPTPLIAAIVRTGDGGFL
jgi:hypothetical protein